MNPRIEQQLISLLQPLLGVTLKVKQGDIPVQEGADLEIISNSVLGMGNNIAQDVDEQGNLLIYNTCQAEVVIRYFGSDGVMKLSALAGQLHCITTSEQFQRANIGIGLLGEIETVERENAEQTLVQYSQFRFFIHYTTVLNDPVGAIETIQADHNGSKINIHLTR